MRKVLFSTVLLLSILSKCVFAEPLTPELCRSKVQEAVKLIEAEGEKAFEKIKDPNSQFRFADGQGYLWIQTTDAVMVMHPIKPEMDGKDLAEHQDVKGLHIFSAFCEVCEKNGSGWVPYFWPKPGETKESSKVSYVAKVKAGDKEVIVGCGLYDVTKEDIQSKFPNDAIYEE